MTGALHGTAGPGLLRAVVVPHPPLLFPELTGPEAEATAGPVRVATARAVRDLLAVGFPALVIVGAGGRTRWHGAGSWGTLAGFGVALTAPADVAARHERPPSLPLSLAVGCRLVDLAGGPDAGPHLQAVAADAGAEACRRLGAELAFRRPDAAWLVLGDGTTKRTERAPGAFDPRAERFDADAEAALASGRPERVLGLDAAAAAELGAAGLAAWQVLAGAWEVLAGGAPARAAVGYAGAPFGVGYLVVRWSDPRPDPGLIPA